MYKFIICLFILIISLPVSAEFVTYSNSRPYYRNNNSIYRTNQPRLIRKSYNRNNVRRNHIKNRAYHNYNNIYLSKKNLSALEKHVLDKTFQRENEISRLERLENLAFGSIQSGDLYSRYQNVENAILARPKYKQNSILNNIANYFVGQSTGLSPNLYPYSNSNFNTIGGFSNYPNSFSSPGYSNSKYQQFSNGIFGGGWGIQNQDFGNGSTIRILD